MGNTVQKLRRRRDQEKPREEEQESSSTFTCEICIEPMLPSSTNKFNNNNTCIHPFCTDCIAKYIQVKIDENVADIQCPALSCDRPLEPLSCRSILPPKAFDKWCDVLCESAVLGFERCYCPNRSCSALIVNECGGKVTKTKCPNCKRLFCFECKSGWHYGYRCDETGEMINRNDVQFGVFMETRNWKRCPRCGHCVQLVEGCNFVKCRCGTNFCYKCGMEYRDVRCRCGVEPHLCMKWMFWFSILAIVLTASALTMRRILYP